MADAVRVIGARELRKALKDADGHLKDLSAVHRRIAGIVATEAQRTAPVASGALASTVRGSGTTTQARVQAGGKPRGVFHRTRKRRDGSTYQGRRIDVVTYAYIVQSRNWFMSRAITSTKEQWLPIYEHDMGKLCDRINGSTRGA